MPTRRDLSNRVGLFMQPIRVCRIPFANRQPHFRAAGLSTSVHSMATARAAGEVFGRFHWLRHRCAPTRAWAADRRTGLRAFVAQPLDLLLNQGEPKADQLPGSRGRSPVGLATKGTGRPAHGANGHQLLVRKPSPHIDSPQIPKHGNATELAT